jgi:D-tyrosyl-tRNA(Tyr) deacylase
LKAVIQRVQRGRVSVDGKVISEIGRGAVILLGVGHGDSAETARWLADKTAQLRIFEDADGKMNRSLVEAEGEALVVSQFTLYADTRKGRRPSFIGAADPAEAEPLVEAYAGHLRTAGLITHTGIFGAHMLVEIENDGPVTILLERSGA